MLNYRPDTLDLATQEGESEKFVFSKIETYLREKYTTFLVLELFAFSVLTMGTRERYHQRSKIKFVSYSALR